MYPWALPVPLPRALSRATVAFSELYVFGDRAPQATPKLLALHGAQVTVAQTGKATLPPTGG
jgi:hypothetical protein